MRDVDALSVLFHERGRRVTPQRQVIFSVLAGATSHPTVDMVYEAAREIQPTLSLRSVYQTLEDLEELGEVRLVQIGAGPRRIDIRTDHHEHLLCTRCGRVHNVDVDVENLIVPSAQRHGFEIESTDVVFTGRCPLCRER